ncbi:hypothetical protein [Mangrovivirga cuniculi]|uniref:hypothetical protein n=1 Tax=Mangrovivirga cuniculi TaxID=2715131 RepID=UPI001FE278E9|nr:hypothetical protein [Mangrovivirga cuniculi]
MNKINSLIIFITLFILPGVVNAQIEDDKLGAWYMYFFNTTFKDGPWGFQGDIQYRNWNLGEILNNYFFAVE